MEIIKNFEDFSQNLAPGADVFGSRCFSCDSDECSWFGVDEYTGQKITADDDEEQWEYTKDNIVPELRNLLDNYKISFDGNQLWYYDDDEETKNVLKDYIPDAFEEN